MILVLGIYGTQTSYEKSDYFVPLHVEKSNDIMIMSIDNSNYKQGQIMNVTGKVSHSSEGASVLMKIIDPTNNTIGDFHSAVNRFGIFTQFYVIPDTFSSGKYTVNAYYEGDPKKTLLSFDINISNTSYGQAYISIPFGASSEGNKINFKPSTIVVPQGTKITWTNNDATVHTVTSGKVNPDGTFSLSDLFEGGYIPPGQNLEISPNPGNYTYFCKIHPWLGGTISVEKTPMKATPVPPVKAKPVPPVKAKPVPPVKAKPVPPVTPKPVPPVKAKPVPPVTSKPVQPLTAKPAPSTNSTLANSTALVTNSSQSTESDNFLSIIWKDLLGFFTGGGSSVSHSNNTTKSNSSQTFEPAPSPVTAKPAPSPVTAKPAPSPVTAGPASTSGTASPSYDSTLLSYWTFDNDLTVTKDQGVLGKNLIQVGKGKIVSGRVGNATDFTGTNYFKASNPSLYNFTSSTPFSIAFWIKIPSTSVPVDFVSKASGGHGPGWDIWSYSNGNLFFTMGNGKIFSEVISTISVNDNSWQHIVCTYDGSKNQNGMKIYVNGIKNKQGSNKAITYSISTNQSLAIGASENGLLAVHAGTLMDDLRIYNVELSEHQVSALYHYYRR